ncbi:MAG: D-alanyl-D-alanine carboxypeptidase family protein [Lutibacter sp.]
MNNRIIYTFILLVYLNLNWVCLNAQINLNCNQLMGIEKMDLLGGLNQLQPEAYKAFKKMKKAALKDGINIQLVSGYRSFNRQLVIWNTKFQRSLDKGRDSLSAFKQNLKYSAIKSKNKSLKN